jgi:hypothetical protein
MCPTEDDSGMLMSSVCIVMLYWQEEGEWGRVQCKEVSGMRQLTRSKEPARRGIRNCVDRATIPSKGFFSSKQFMYI